jgi:hypothetical protein
LDHSHAQYHSRRANSFLGSLNTYPGRWNLPDASPDEFKEDCKVIAGWWNAESEGKDTIVIGAVDRDLLNSDLRAWIMIGDSVVS